MNETTIARLDRLFSSRPILRAASTPTDTDVAQAEAALHVKFAADYVEFVKRYGGAMVGPLPVFGLRPVHVMGNRWSVVDVTDWYREQKWPGANDWYVISEDGFSNPIAIDRQGLVVSYDHNTNEQVAIASSFEHFLESCLRKS